jgi:transcriptional regulator with XRE-family HTH domain
MGFPERLKQLRKEKGLSQIMLAKELGVSGGTVAMWETGKRKPQFEMFDKLCTFFDRSMDYILGASDDDRSFALINEEVQQLGDWQVEEQYEDMLRKYTLLDDYGKDAVDAVLRKEFNRAQEQGTLNNSMSISVSVRSKPVVG